MEQNSVSWLNHMGNNIHPVNNKTDRVQISLWYVCQTIVDWRRNNHICWMCVCSLHAPYCHLCPCPAVQYLINVLKM